MLVIWILTAILESTVPVAHTLWTWFGDHVLLTILMLLFLA